MGRVLVNVLIASSEVAPFAKTGGLADVCGALPLALSRLGVQVSVIMPAFRRQIGKSGIPIRDMDISFDIPIGSKVVPGRMLQSKLPGSDVTIYFVDQPEHPRLGPTVSSPRRRDPNPSDPQVGRPIQ